MMGTVTAVSASSEYTFSKPNRDTITLIVGFGVEGDVHAGPTVKHRSRLARDPAAPNLRQVHLLHAELHDELLAAGFRIAPGEMGENITTRGIDLLGLPSGTVVHLGEAAAVEITGLRNPCAQLNGLQEGLTNACLARDAKGTLIRKAGVMAVNLQGGPVKPGDRIRIAIPRSARHPLQPV